MDNVRTLRPAISGAETRAHQLRDLILEAQAIIELASFAVTVEAPPHPAIVSQVLESAHTRLREAIAAVSLLWDDLGSASDGSSHG